MTPESALDLFRQALLTALLIASPMLAAGLVIGLAISVLQAVTQIHEMTLTFIPKMIGVILVLLMTLPWMLRVILDYTSGLLGNLGSFA
jgi:flagellar biosynthetic protein FliQ